MPANKRQHFVPQFYLRLFSDAEGRSVGVFNLAQRRLIPLASLKTQAYREWFYGKDLHAESILTEIEGVAARVVKAMVTRDRLPTRYSADHQAIVTFVALQLARTEAGEAKANEQAHKLGKALLAHHIKDPKLLKFLPDLQITLTHGVAESIRHTLHGMPVLYDLKYKLIVNASACPFIASDAPIALHNRLFEGICERAVVGFANVGLQIFVPLGPSHALLFYDEAAYEVGVRTSNLVRLVNPNHAHVINDLQWEVAHRNLYVSKHTKGDELCRDAERWATLRRADRVEVETTALPDNGGGRRARLLLGGPASVVRLDLPFVRVMIPPPESRDGFETLPLRNAEWASFVIAAGRDLAAGAIDRDQYLRLMSKVPINRRRRS